MANKVTVLIDVVTDRANTALGGFRKSIGEADGALGKFKAGSSAAFASLKAVGPEAALAAGAALVTFGIKSVNAFNDLAISSGKLAEALGMPVEDASRLVEVAGDIGIEMDTLEKTIGRMNRSAADTPGAFAAIGAQIVKNTDGTTNVNETFLATVDALNRMPDATQRASAAQKIFGRSWMDIAELVGQGADEIRTSLEGVSDAKIIDEDEVAKAREYRAAMDNLADAFQDVALIAGETLVPILTDTADAFSDFKNATTQADEKTNGLISTLHGTIPTILKFVNPIARGVAILDHFSDSNDDAAAAVESNSGALVQASINTGLLAVAAADAADANSDLADGYSEMEDGVRRANEALADHIALTLEATGSTFDAERATLEFAQAMDDQYTATVAANDVLEDSESTDQEKTEALRALRLEQIGNAEAALELAQAYAEESGAAEGSAESAQLQIDALSRLQGEYPGIADDVGVMIDKLLEVPGTIDPAAAAIGSAISEGIGEGIDASAHVAEAAARRVVEKALAAAIKTGKIQSPSRLFAEEVGQPISEGLAEGIAEDSDRIGEALTKAIESATKDAIAASDDLVALANERLSFLWSGLDEGRSRQDMLDSVDDAEAKLADSIAGVTDAETNLATVLADPESTAKDIARARKDLASANDTVTSSTERLEDANFRLTKASQDMIMFNATARASWVEYATAAGLAADEIGFLIAAQENLAKVRVDETVAQNAITAEAAGAQKIRARFGEVTGQGLVSADQLNHLKANQDPAYQLFYMDHIIKNLEAFFGTIPGMATGGMVKASPGGTIVRLGEGGRDEMVTPLGTGGGGGNTINLTVNAGMGANGHRIGNEIIGVIKEYERTNGTRWRSS